MNSGMTRLASVFLFLGEINDEGENLNSFWSTAENILEQDKQTAGLRRFPFTKDR